MSTITTELTWAVARAGASRMQPAVTARRRRLAVPQCTSQRPPQGWSVFAGAPAAARKAAIRRLDAVMNDGPAVHSGDVWGLDPWRPRPV